MRAINLQADLFADPSAKARSERILALLLEALAQADELYLARNPKTPALYRAGVRYQREPIGAEQWNTIGVVRKLGHGDCEDLAAWRVAELRRAGVAAHPVFTSRLLPSGVLMYHILVRHPNGTIEDPSKLLGMRGAA